jgi:glycosyltransferase involved in cell wall biosynthesis
MVRVKRIIVCAAQVPFASGGAEAQLRNLVAQLQRRGHLAELVALPFAWHPSREILAHAAAWRMLNLRTAGPHDVDLVIASRFPTYFVRHPHKVTWLIHQHRPVYELCGTPYGGFTHDDVDVGVRDTVIALDRRMLAESQRIFANSGRVAARLERFNRLRATPLYHPPPLAGRLTAGPSGDYVLSVGRLESIKRVDLVVRAMRHVRAPVRLVIAGDGRERPAIEALISELVLGGRVELRRHVDTGELIDLYAGALAVVYPPYDEDYGYVTLEAFLARKPVVTAEDSGGPLEFVDEGITGSVCAPRPEALAAAIDRLAADRGRAAALGDAGFARASAVSWDDAIDALVGDAGAAT